jgi:hypothetical protein
MVSKLLKHTICVHQNYSEPQSYIKSMSLRVGADKFPQNEPL